MSAADPGIPLTDEERQMLTKDSWSVFQDKPVRKYAHLERLTLDLMHECGVNNGDPIYQALKAVEKAARVSERERCAKVCDKFLAANTCAQVIRELGDV